MGATASSNHRLPQLAKYDVVEEIGHGGMATVYRAKDRRLGREVAVKVIHPHLRDSREVVSRFNTEARAVAKLRHPNIVEVYDVSEVDEVDQYLVVELLRGTTLRKILQERGAMPPEVAAAFALDMLDAIGHANGAGVVHRDIKPENVLIEHRAAPVASDRSGGGDGATQTPMPGTSASGDRVIVKLTDFGIAKLLDAQGVTSTGQVLGSPAHMAPEQIEGGEIDARADVFGMGVLLYECMVGHLPFEGNNPAQVLRRVLDGQYPAADHERPLVGARWSAVLDRALAHAPGDRYADAGAMREAIVAELTRLGVAGMGGPRQHLESWFDDPDAFVAAHAKRMVDALCALGAEERKAGDAIGAAADYNRALAHAPHDPQLLRLVAGMQRAEARGRLLRRAAMVSVLMVGLGGAAFVVGRLVRDYVPRPVATAPAVTPLPVVPAPPASASTAAQPSAIAPPTAATTVHPLPMPPPRVVERAMSLDLQPSMGVQVSVDGAAAYSVSTGQIILMNEKPHALLFSCPVCTSVERAVGPGDKDETLPIRLSIKPATLVISGDATKTYQLVEHPEALVRAGTNSVAMRSEFESVHVVQLGTGAPPFAVRLHAGDSMTASF